MKIRMPELLPYQSQLNDYLNSPDIDTVIFLKSRQSGGTWFNKWVASKWLLTERNNKIGYVTPTNKLGRSIHKELSKSLQPFITAQNSVELLIEVDTGSTLQFFSAESMDSVRGFQFDYLIVDEAAFMSDDFFNFVLRPTMLVRGKKTLMCSTPNASTGFFHQYCQLAEDGNKFRIVKISIYDNPFINEQDISEIKRTVPNRVFRQEYLAEFLDNEGAVFSNYRNCIVHDPQMTGRYYAAIDWAKENDYTVLTVMNDKKEVVFIYRVTGMDYTTQVDVISGHLNKWKPIVTVSEENNIGSVVNELLRRKYSGSIKRINLNNENKREYIERLVVAFETGDIWIPEDEQLLKELSWFSVDYNPKTQTVKYGAKNNLHDDMVISLAYCYNFINRGKYVLG